MTASPVSGAERPADQIHRTSRSFLALGAGNYGAMAISVGTNILLARRLGADQWGSLALLLMASQVLLLAAVNWTHAGFVRFGAVEFAAKGTVTETLSVRLGMLWPAAGLGIAMMLVARAPLAAYLGVPPAYIWLLVVHFSAVCALSLVGAIFQARQQMAHYGLSLMLDKAAMLFCVVVLPAAWTGQALPALACYALSSLSVAVWGVAVVGLRALRPVWPSRAALRQMLVFSAPLLLTSWAGYFGTNWFDLVVLKKYVAVSGIGVYSLAAQLAGVVQQITVIFATLLLPELSLMVVGGQNDRIRMLMERLLPYWLLGISVLFTVVLLASRVGVPFVFGPTFRDASPVLALLMVASAVLALHNAFTPLVTALGSTWALTGIAFVSTGVNVVGDLLLIPRFGILGSAWATVLAYVTGTALVVGFAQRRIGGRVLRLGWLCTPALTAYGCFTWFDGVRFYLAVLIAVGINVLVLVQAFRLFCAEDALFVRGLNLRLPFGLGAGARSERGV